MQALEGPVEARAKAALFAGCDIALHCNGKMDEMKEVAMAAKVLEGLSAKRADAALARLQPASSFDPEAARSRLAVLMESADA